MAGLKDANIAVRIGADLAPLQRDMGQAKRELKGFEGAAKKIGGNLAALSAAGGAAAGAFTAVAINSGNAAREIRVLSAISGETTANFQTLARQTRLVGVEQEQLGDILKDTREKMGEFVATGGGGFKDFAERVGLSTADVARQFRGLTGSQILGKMQKMLGDLNIPLEQQVFFFESVASESSKLIPVFKTLNESGGDLKETMKAVLLNDEELKRLQDMGDAFQTLGSNLAAAFDRTLAGFAPTITEWVRGLNDSLVDMNENVLPETKKQIAEVAAVVPKGPAFTAEGDASFFPADLRERSLEDVRDFLDELEDAYGRGMEAINFLVERSMGRQASIVVQGLQDIARSMSTHSRKAFEVQKAFELSNAVVSGYAAAVSAWRYGMAVGGHPAAVAFTAASLARTGALIQSIRSTSFGSGGGGGTAGGGGGAAAPAAAAPQENRIVNINLEGQSFGREQVRGLLSEINNALDEGYTLRLR